MRAAAAMVIKTSLKPMHRSNQTTADHISSVFNNCCCLIGFVQCDFPIFNRID